MKNPDYVVKRSRAGLGLYARRDYAKDEFIIEYTGETITDAEADRRGGRYLFALNNEWTLDAKDRIHTARYINHACRPNAYAELNEDETRIYIRAAKKIKAGEEITFNYGKEYIRDYIAPTGCKCKTCLKKLKKTR